MPQYAHINPEILSWARERARFSVETLARKVNTRAERIDAWEAGEKQPTFKQAQTVAEKTYVPFGFFFLAETPREQLPLPDLRTVENQPINHPSAELLDTVRSVMQKHAWYQEYARDEQVDPLPFVGRFDTNAEVENIVKDMRQVLDTTELLPEQYYWDEYERALITAAESRGILVMRSGIVGNNTHRPLNVEEFRGFAISDEVAPTIFVNSKDAPTARLFTLIHELAHLWLGTSGISSAGLDEGRDIERVCNAVAGEFLVPANNFLPLWESIENWRDNLPSLSRRFHVSRLVIARRAMDLGLITSNEYGHFYQAEREAFRNRKSSGGDYYRNQRTKNSLRFSRAVLSEAMGGRLLLREAGSLLGISPAKVKEYARRLST